MAYYEIDNRPKQIDFELKNDKPVQRILQNAKNLLMTRMGEVPFDRFRGFDMSLMNLPIDKFRARLLPELDRLFMWERNLEAADAEATIDETGNIYIRVVVKIDLDE